jgi:hypothetical protein
MVRMFHGVYCRVLLKINACWSLGKTECNVHGPQVVNMVHNGCEVS